MSGPVRPLAEASGPVRTLAEVQAAAKTDAAKSPDPAAG